MLPKLSQQAKEKWFNFFYKQFNLEKEPKLLNLNWSKPWWDVFWKQKSKVIWISILFSIDNIYRGLLPILIGNSINNRNYTQTTTKLSVFAHHLNCLNLGLKPIH